MGAPCLSGDRFIICLLPLGEELSGRSQLLTQFASGCRFCWFEEAFGRRSVN